MPSSHASSEAGSFSSGPPAASHGYKKSLSSKADPNTALSEDPNRMQYPGPYLENPTDQNSFRNRCSIFHFPPLHAAHRP